LLGDDVRHAQQICTCNKLAAGGEKGLVFVQGGQQPLLDVYDD